MPTLTRLLDRLQTCILVVVGFLFLQGRGSHSTFVALAFLVPCIRWIFAPAYRHRWFQRYQQSRTRIEAYSAHDAGRRFPLAAAWWWIGLPIAVLSLGNGSLQSSGDNKGTVLTTVALVTAATPDISSVRSTARMECGTVPYYYLACHGTAVYSAYPAGMLTFSVPVFLLARIAGADFQQGKVHERLEKLTSVLVGVLASILFLLLVAHLVRFQAAWVTAVFVAMASAIFSTVSAGLWSHGGVVIGILTILLIEVHRPKRTWSQGAAAALMVASRLSAITFLVPFAAWVAWRSPRRAALFSLAALVCFGPWAAYHYGLYGHVWGAQIIQSSGFVRELSRYETMLSVLFSPARGMFVYQPWLLLAPFGLVLASRAASDPRSKLSFELSLICLIAAILQLGLISSWGDWGGGWCWGSRLMTEAVVLLAIPAAFAVERVWTHRLGRRTLVVLLVLCFFLHAVHLYLHANRWMSQKPDSMTWNQRYWQWSDPPFLYPLRDWLHR